MNTSLPYGDMSVSRRLDLIAEIWDSIPDSGDALDVPAWHQEELEKRLAVADAHPEAGIPWEVVKARLRKRRIKSL